MKIFAVLLMSVCAVACSKKADPTAAAMVSGSATTANVVSDPSAASSAHEKRHRCPTELAGATATAMDVDGGVQITITASDPQVAQEIRARSNRAVETTRRMQDHPGRNGEMRSGPCAAIVHGAKTDETDIDGGALLTIMATPAVDVAHVRSEVHDRLKH